MNIDRNKFLNGAEEKLSLTAECHLINIRNDDFRKKSSVVVKMNG